MSPNTHGLQSPSLPDGIVQPSTEPERNLVSHSPHVLSPYIDDQQNQHSGLGFFANARDIVITGGIFVSLSRRLCTDDLKIIVCILAARIMSIFSLRLPLPILAKCR
jgi:hypothetical protein